MWSKPQLGLEGDPAGQVADEHVQVGVAGCLALMGFSAAEQQNNFGTGGTVTYSLVVSLVMMRRRRMTDGWMDGWIIIIWGFQEAVNHHYLVS